MIKTLQKPQFKSSFKNLNEDQLKILSTFLVEKPFVICSCDKNVGFAILNKDLYLSLSFDHLNSNTQTYKELNFNPLTSTKNKIESELNNLNLNGHISDELFRNLKSNNSKLGKFKMMPKLHKSKFGIRPIVASINHPTSLLCFVIDFILQIFVINTETYLKDSQNLIQFCEYIVLDDEIELSSCDFDSLYTNIESEDAIHKITDFLSRFFKNPHINNIGINTFLKLIFYNNVFEFENKYYIQIKGLAMGCKCGPSVANLYLYILEYKWLCIHRPIVYKRFIDDIFVANKGPLNREELCAQFGNLNLNFVSDKVVPFLDLNITIDNLQKKFKFFLFIKPTNTFQYLQSSSNHPKHIFNNIPKSLFLRIRRICSNKIDFFYFSRDLFVQLLKRGYEYKSLYKTLMLVSKLDRVNLIQYREKVTSSNNYEIRICMDFDYNFLDLKTLFKAYFENLKNIYGWLDKFKVNFTNSILPNFKKILIDNCKYTYNKKFFTKKCNVNNCKICNFIYESSFNNLDKICFPLKSNCNCKSECVVYIIMCKKCDHFYIGETGASAEKRLSQHIYDIDKFSPFGLNKRSTQFRNTLVLNNSRVKRLQKTNVFKVCPLKPLRKISEVAEHFNLKGHNKYLDLKFCIFDKNLKDREIRQSIETDLMNIIKIFKPLINRKIPNFKFVKKLCFS